MHVIEAGCYYSIDELLFTDDPMLGADHQERARSESSRGGSGLVTPVRDKKVWRVQRDITLGAGIDDYDRCS